MKPFTLAILTCVWKRPEITEIFFDCLLSQMSLVKARWRVFSAGPEDQRIDHPGIDYFEYPNRPLGRKFNACLGRTRDWSPDAVLVLGSDDLVTAALINEEIEVIKRGTDIVGCLDAFFLRAKTGESIHWPGYEEKTEPIGSGRMYSKRILENAEWSLWKDELHSSLDGSANRKCVQLGASWLVLEMDPPDRVFLGIKGDPMLNSWEALKKPSKSIDTDSYLLRSFGPEISGKILALGEKNV